MAIRNRDVAEIFARVADSLDIQGGNVFRIRAYRNAARAVGDLPREVASLVEEGEDLTRLPGIGRDLAGKIEEIVRTGRLGQLEELERQTPPSLSALMKIESLGPKRVKILYQRLGIRGLDELIEAARQNRIRELEGFGARSEEKILRDAERLKQSGERHRLKLAAAERITEPLLAYLRKVENVGRVVAAGSYRRRKETVGDVDILVTFSGGCQVMDRFVRYDEVERVLSHGETRSTVILRGGLQVDVRVVDEESYGAALHYFTGSKPHNVAIRTMGVKMGLKINEYGVFRGERRIAGRTEEEVYARVGLACMEPELREDRGELEAAREGRLPRLVTQDDIRGDLQVHTHDTDGSAGLEEMADAAGRMGYEYLAITDHSRRVRMARGLDEKRLADQIRRIDRLNGRAGGPQILKSCEVDILEDGSLDLPDAILKELDFVIGSIHYNRNLSRERQTERVLRAMDNPLVNILAHPTGRLIGEREPYAIDLERVMEGARQRGCYLELNAHPDRLDMDDVYCKMAKEMGLRVPISTDAHSIDNLQFIKYGIYQARRGWLEPQDVLNTRPWEELGRLLRRV
jgi:DNA polymerase (family 10)